MSAVGRVETGLFYERLKGSSVILSLSVCEQPTELYHIQRRGEEVGRNSQGGVQKKKGNL